MPATRQKDSSFIPYSEDVLVSSAARTTSSQTASLTGFGAASKLLLYRKVTAFAGTTPTLDVVLEDSLDSGATWRTIATFPQKVNSTFAATDFQQVLPSALFADTVRVRWTIGGSAGQSFTFSVVCASWV